jgi:hypothetical protein
MRIVPFANNAISACTTYCSSAMWLLTPKNNNILWISIISSEMLTVYIILLVRYYTIIRYILCR